MLPPLPLSLATEASVPTLVPTPEMKVTMRIEMSVPWASMAMVPPSVRSAVGWSASAVTATP
ncbi:hypothetical protein D3C72_1584680 [compost metagenome]